MDPARSADFYDALAPRYDDGVARPGDVWVRGAFQEFAAARIPAGARLLDFGCGTGLDAAWYADRGYRVLAFDNSPRMVDQLRARCPSDRVEAWADGYDAFLADLPRRGPIDAVTANFAVVNLLPDVAGWLRALAAVLPADAPVLLGALNPLGLRDLWRPNSVVRAVRGAERGGANPHVRYWPGQIRRMAADFRLVSVAGAASLIRYGRGPRDWRDPRTLGERLERRIWQLPPWSHLGRFAFLELRRCR